MEAKTGTIPPRKVPITGINCDRTPAAIPNATAEGKPMIRNEIVKTILAKIPRITLAAINPPALDTPIVQTLSLIHI